MEQPAARHPLAERVFRKSTLCLTHSARNVFLRGDALVVADGAGRERSLPFASLRRVILVGKAFAPAPVLYQLARRAVPVDWLDIYGRPVGQLLPVNREADFMLVPQAAFCKGPRTLPLARDILLAKLDNCHATLRRRRTLPPGWSSLRSSMAAAEDAERLRGFEGAAARMYFSQWHGLLHKFAWTGRHAHPAPDPVNMLLSFGYSLLRNRLASSLRHAGLDPRLGFFHVGRGRHAALASDLMEPLRALVDSRVLSLVRRQELAPADFALRADGGVGMAKNVFPRILGEYEDMFDTVRKFYLSPGEPGLFVNRSPNDLIDDMAESFAIQVHDGHGCIIPRLAPCAAA